MNARREILWMALPIVFLGGVGWLWRTREAARVVSGQPFRMRVEKVSFVPLTPREVFDGYDTKVVLSLGHSGATPKWWDQEQSGYSSGPRGKVVAVTPTHKQKVSVLPYVSIPHRLENGEWQMHILTGLAKVPASAGELRFIDSVVTHYNRMGNPDSPRMGLDFRLRPKGQGTSVPQVDRHTSLKLEKLFVAPEPYGFPGSRVKIWVQGAERYSISSVQLRDGKGNRVPYNNPTYNEWKTDRSTMSRDGETPLTVFVTNLYGDEIKTPQASVDAIFYNRDEWPLQIRIPLRDARGKYLYSPLSGANCRLKSLTTRKPTAQERTQYFCDTVVSLEVVSLQPDSSPVHSWDVNEAACIEDQTGSRWTQNNLAAQNIPIQYFNEFPTDVVDTGDEENHSGKIVNYFINLSSISKSDGPLWFKDSIRLNDGPVLPVKIQVRA